MAIWADDPRTSVILMNLESFSHPARFDRAARSVSREHLLLTVNSGKPGAGTRGQQPVAFEALEEAIAWLSKLVAEFGFLEEFGINTFFASGRAAHCKAADARARISP